MKTPAASVPVSGNDQALSRLLMILLDNAIQYTPEGGRVGVTVEVAGSGALIRVEDTGIGIAPEGLPKIWDRFWRADKVRSRNAGGAGLGLALARWIAEHHHATLTVVSTPDKGSVFTLQGLEIGRVADS